jgi:polar amino acid transport system substrate-binding protein
MSAWISFKERVLSRLSAAFALVALLSAQVAMAQAKSVKVVSDPYPPYVMDEPDRKGFVTEMTLKILRDAGYEAEYINVPFTRALVGLERGLYDGLLAVSPGRAGFIYPEDAFATSVTSFFVLKNRTWTYQGIPSLKSITLGTILGYQFAGGQPGAPEDKIDFYIAQNKDNLDLIQSVGGEDGLEKNIKKLALDRIDAVAEDPAVFWYTANKLGLSDKFKTAGDLTQPTKITVGFPASNPRAKELVKVISDGVKKLKDTGEYKTLLMKYGIK